MDHHAKSHGTMVGMLANRRQRWIVAVAVLPSLTLAGLLLSMLPAYALPPAEQDAGLQAPPADRIVLAAKVRGAAAGARLLNNGTRSRENREEEADSTSQKAAGDSPAKAAPAPTPAPAATAPQPAQPAAARAPEVEQTEQMRPIAGLGQGRDASDIECIANCLRSTPTVRVGGRRQAPDPSLTEGGMECIAGCYGVNMTSAIIDRQDLPGAAPRDEARGSGPATNRITVLRGVTRTKSYAPAN